MHGYRVSIYICMCMPTRSRAVRLIERSLRLDIFPFHLKFTTGWIFLRPIFSHRNRVTFFEAADHRAKSRQIARLLSETWLTWEIESSFRKILFSLSSPRHSLSLESYIRNEFLLLSHLPSIDRPFPSICLLRSRKTYQTRAALTKGIAIFSRTR